MEHINDSQHDFLGSEFASKFCFIKTAFFEITGGQLLLYLFVELKGKYIFVVNHIFKHIFKIGISGDVRFYLFETSTLFTRCVNRVTSAHTT